MINSVQGKFGMAFRSSYAASKHALVGFFDCLRAEHAQRGVGVLNVFPGYVRTRYVPIHMYVLCGTATGRRGRAGAFFAAFPTLVLVGVAALKREFVTSCFILVSKTHVCFFAARLLPVIAAEICCVFVALHTISSSSCFEQGRRLASCGPRRNDSVSAAFHSSAHDAS